MTGGFIKAPDGALSREVSARVYSQDVLSAACSAFQEFCRTEISGDGTGRLLVSIYPHEPERGRNCVLAFWNFVLNSEAERRFAES
jgi:hypothetical protein